MEVTMKSRKTHRKTRHGAALIVALVFVLLFSTLAVSLVSLCNTNVQIADNQRKAGLARSSAQSGLETFRYWLEGKDGGGTEFVSMPGNVPPAGRFDYLANDLAAAGAPVEISYDGNDVAAVSMPLTTFDSSAGQAFTAVLRPTVNLDILQLEVTGTGQGLQRTIRVEYQFGTRAHSVFDFGVATRGPLSLSGNIDLTGYTISVESDVYIESMNQNEALSITGNSQIAGDVKIVNPDGYADLQGGKAAIGGETAPGAYNHVESGVAPTEFPLPMPDYFLHYVQGDIDMNDLVHTNVRIPPNTNPSFAAGTTFQGVLFIDAPNIVTFSGNVTIIGLIVGNGDYTDNSGTNRINFMGTVDSHPVTDLPDTTDFHDLRSETGTFLMAPGFAVSFGGDFATLNGAIASNGVDFYGNAGGVINGSIVNYSDAPMSFSGNSDLVFNRTGNTVVPAGFGPEIIMHYIPESYEEVFDM
jgi:hypothetical protein